MLRTSTDLIRSVGNTILSSKSNTKKLTLKEEEIQEWIRCRSNPLYYIKKYVKFETVGGVSSYAEGENFHPKLKRFVKAIFKYHKATLMASRQLGKSSINAGLISWSSTFYPRNTAIILNFKKEAALANLAKIKFINDELPDFLRLETTSKSDIKTYINYSNGSKINVMFPSSVHSKSTIARSLTSPILYIDEAAFISDMSEVFGSAQQILSKARTQAKKNGYPYFIAISSTPNGVAGGGGGEWFFNRWENGVDSELLFIKDPKNPKLENWIDNCETLINDPSKNGFIKIRYHWSEDTTKSEAWYNEQCRELADQRKVNQELDLIFVGTSNCIFDDDLLSKFKSKEKVDLVSCPHETNLVLYEKELDKNDYYLIGVDTARSLSGAYNSIEIFSFAKFNQIAEFNYRLGSFTKYGEIISFIFKWLRKQVGNNIILCIESNTIGLAPIEHLLNHVHDVNFRDFIYKEPKSKEYGISTTGISKDMMIGCLTEIIKEDPSVIKSQDLINQMSAIERNRGGSISSETFSDLFMASCFNAYVRKMKASEILPQINMGKSVYDAHRIETLSSFVNLNTNIVTPQEEFNKLNNMYNEYEIEQLMLLELEKKNTYQGERDEYFSPFL